jgi:hypothetical protein
MIMAAGLLPDPAVAVGVFGVTLQISSVGYMVPASLGSATATRVANNLGAGNARAAALVFRRAAPLRGPWRGAGLPTRRQGSGGAPGAGAALQVCALVGFWKPAALAVC